jgi:hypothetical protein
MFTAPRNWSENMTTGSDGPGSGLSVAGELEMLGPCHDQLPIGRGAFPPQDWSVFCAPVLDQGSCLSCVTYSAYVVFQGIARLRLDEPGYLLPFSVEELYRALRGDCLRGQEPLDVMNRVAAILNGRSTRIQWESGPLVVLLHANKLDMLQNGPAVGVVRNGKDFQKGGSKANGPDGSPAHAVAVIGMNVGRRSDGSYTDQGDWIVQNSWGADWPGVGANGILTFDFNSHDIEKFKFAQPQILSFEAKEK